MVADLAGLVGSLSTRRRVLLWDGWRSDKGRCCRRLPLLFRDPVEELSQRKLAEGRRNSVQANLYPGPQNLSLEIVSSSESSRPFRDCVLSALARDLSAMQAHTLQLEIVYEGLLLPLRDAHLSLRNLASLHVGWDLWQRFLWRRARNADQLQLVWRRLNLHSLRACRSHCSDCEIYRCVVLGKQLRCGSLSMLTLK